MGDAMGCGSGLSRVTPRQPAIIGVLVPFPPAGHAEPSRTLPTLCHGVAWRGLGEAHPIAHPAKSDRDQLILITVAFLFRQSSKRWLRRGVQTE